jgi:hypothetical protein
MGTPPINKWWSTGWFVGSLTAVLVLVTTVSLIWASAADDEVAALVRSGTVFLVGVISFFGFLWLSRALRTPRGVFQDGDVRLAIAAAFFTVYIELLSLYAFADGEPTDFASSFADDFQTLTGLVVGFYFATSGALEWARIRAGSQTSHGEHDTPTTTV